MGAVDITINSTVSCAEEYLVNIDGEFQLYGTGESSAADCSFMFKAGAVSEGTCEPGLCYMFNTYAQFEDKLVSLSVEAGTDVMTYSKKSAITHGPICMENQASLKVLLSQGKDYVYDAKKPGYSFRLSIFHHCGEKGQTKNMKFEEVVANAKGYHTVEEREANERSQFISGILLGFGLACCFLLVLLVAYCYTRNSPNRGPSRSVGVPKVGGFKKKMTPNKAGANEVEMGVGYKATDPDKNPEAEAFLTSGARPPADKAH